jgi:hypothetical protein
MNIERKIMPTRDNILILRFRMSGVERKNSLEEFWIFSLNFGILFNKIAIGKDSAIITSRMGEKTEKIK